MKPAAALAALVGAALVGAALVGACGGAAGRGGGAAAAPGAAGAERTVTVGDGSALVAERRRVEIQPGGSTRFVVPERASLDGARVVGAPARSLHRDGDALVVGWAAEAPAGPRDVELVYRLPGLSWRAVYTVVVDEARALADVHAAVEIVNESGAALARARVIVDPRGQRATPPPQGADPPGAAAAPLVPLPGVVDLPAGAVVPVALARAAAVPARRALVFDPVGPGRLSTGPTPARELDYPAVVDGDVRAFLELDNTRAHGLGAFLPAGNVRFFARDADGRTRWIADQPTADVAAGERLRVPLGVTAGLRGERRRIELDDDGERRRVTEELELVVYNDGDAPRTVTIVERLARHDRWRVTRHSGGAEKDSPRSLRVVVSVPARGKASFRYRVVYSW